MSKEIIYPEQLKIIIQTNIPGYNQIEYKPSMTVKNVNEKNIQFNPFIKLNKKIINNQPENYKKEQFFNKGLFRSLILYSHNAPSIQNNDLIQATEQGYIDNNIKVTLDTLFPVNSVIYLGGVSYAIGDVQWTIGDWKIDGSKELLNKLPREVLHGINYIMPKQTHKKSHNKTYKQTGGNKYIKTNTKTRKQMPSILKKLEYKITIEMELHEGTNLTQKQIMQSKCNSKLNAIKKSFAIIMGKTYVKKPIYTVKKVKN